MQSSSNQAYQPADQLARDLALDPTSSFIVQAPAGSGKTTLLIQRYLQLLAVAVTEPEECLAITFTRKAAAEMLQRVLAALIAAKNTRIPENQKHSKTWQLARQVLIRDQKLHWNILDNPNRLKIQTIDAFCSSIVARAPVMTKFGCNVEVAEDAQELYISAATNLLTNDNPETDTNLNLIAYHLDNNQTRIIELFTVMLANREKWLANLLAVAKTEDYMAAFQYGLELSMQDVLTNAYKHRPSNFSAILELLNLDGISNTELAQDLSIWQQLTKLLLNEAGELRKTVTKQQGFPAPSAAKHPTEKQILAARKAQMLAILAELATETNFITSLRLVQTIVLIRYTAKQQEIFQALLQILPNLAAHLHVVFQQQGKVDFAEITMSAIHALGEVLNPSELALILDYKIQHIMVDEFQDTSQHQFELLQALTRDWSGSDGKTIFLVGDPMQSIYRFRNAAVGLFLYAKQYGIGDIQLKFLQLTTNFRSSNQIVTWINQVFATSFPSQDDISSGAVSYFSSTAYIGNPVNTGDASVTVAFANNNMLIEASNIAQYIQQQQQTNQEHTIAILVRSRAHLPDIIYVLNMYNISFIGLELDPLISKPIIQDLLSLTNAVLHLGDHLAWYALLRTKWLGLKLPDIQALAGDKQQLIWYNINNFINNPNLSPDAKIRLNNFSVIMQQYLPKLGIVNLSKLIYTIWCELNGIAVLQSALELQSSQEFFKILAQEENSPNIYTTNYLRNKLAKLYAKTKLSVNNPVQIMTIHKAKGLEFDTVIIPGLAQPLKSDSEKLLLWNENLSYTGKPYLLAAPIKSFLETEDAIYNYVKALDRKKTSYEDLRLLYVACTRARTNLYLSAVVMKKSPPTNSLLALIWSEIRETAATANKLAADADTGTGIVKNINNNLTRIKTSYINIPKIINSPVNTNTNTNTAIDLDPNKEWMRHVGTLVHKELWRISSFGVNSWDPSMLAVYKQRWMLSLTKAGVDRHSLNAATELVATALQNTLVCHYGQWILSTKHQDAKSEWALTTCSNDITYNIIIDRTFVDQQDGVRWIIDYKVCNTSESTSSELAGYKVQLAKYAAILAKYCRESVIKTGIYFPLQQHFEIMH